MKYFVRVLHSITPANKLQKHVLEQLLIWNNVLVSDVHIPDLQDYVMRTVEEGNQAFNRCKALVVNVSTRAGGNPGFSVVLPMSEFSLCAVSCTPVAYEYERKE